MDACSSILIARDAASREVLAGFGVDLRKTTTFHDLFDVLSRLDGIRGTWAKIASYRLTEGVLSTPIGRFLREAASRSELQIVFDWCSHRPYGGITRTLIDKLSLLDVDGVVPSVRYLGTPDKLFHPKLLLIGLALPSGEELCLTVLGSANMTAGGLSHHTELGVVFAHRALPRPHTGVAWPEVHDLFEDWLSKARPLTLADLDLLPDNSDELHEWSESVTPASVNMRPYQKHAVEEIVRAWKDRYQRRPSSNWKGTLLVLPPATGKTLCALTAACRILESDEGNGPVVWLSDQPLLAAQAYDEFRRTGFLQRRVMGLLVKAGQIRRSTASEDLEAPDGTSLQSWLEQGAQARPAIVFTTKRDGKSLGALSSLPPRLTIVDEAHHATANEWNQALTYLQSLLVVGLTATPYRKEPESPETQTLLRTFSVGSQPWLSCFMPNRQDKIRNKLAGVEETKIGYGMPVASFYDPSVTGTELPVLSTPTFVIVKVVDSTTGQLVVVQPNGSQPQRIRFFEDPFKEERDLRELVLNPEIVDASLEAIDRDACDRAKQASKDRRTTIVFARNISHAKRLERQFEAEGQEPIVLHSRDGRTLFERRRDLQHVQKKPGSVLVCVDMVTEGVDLPTVDLLVMTRWTSSERLTWQMIGRGLRGPAIRGGTKDVEIVTYELQFGNLSKDAGSVQCVDDLLIEAFGEHAKKRGVNLRVKLPGERAITRKEFDATQGLVNGADRVSSQRRQGSMLVADILARESHSLDGDMFDVVIRTDSGAIVYKRCGVRNPWRVLLNIYDKGCRGRRYRFVVTGSLLRLREDR